MHTSLSPHKTLKVRKIRFWSHHAVNFFHKAGNVCKNAINAGIGVDLQRDVDDGITFSMFTRRTHKGVPGRPPALHRLPGRGEGGKAPAEGGNCNLFFYEISKEMTF